MIADVKSDQQCLVNRKQSYFAEIYFIEAMKNEITLSSVALFCHWPDREPTYYKHRPAACSVRNEREYGIS